MKVWEIRNADVDDYAMLVLPDSNERVDVDKVFGGDGRKLKWRGRRSVEVFVDKRRKKAKPRADVSAFLPGALVLNAKAQQALSGFLGQFGQLLELDVGGVTEYFYNVTNIVRCVDVARSQKYPEGTVSREAFDEAALPSTAAVFKDPSTAPVRLYVNEPGKLVLEQLIASAGLVGVELASAGI